MTLPLTYIFILLLANVDVIPKQKQLSNKTRRKISSMSKLKESRSCFTTKWRAFYKCVQLVQGEIMLISITINFFFNFEENISYVFLVLWNFKISFPSVFTVYLAFLSEKNGEKTLQLTSINFVYIRLPDLRRIAPVSYTHLTLPTNREV